MGRDYEETLKLHKNPEVRDPHTGRFVKGSPGGPGAAVLTKDKVKYHNILRQCVTEEEFKKVAQTLLIKAQQGESWACKELLDRLMGKPKSMVDIDLKQTHVDPKTVINNVAILLGISDDGEDYFPVNKDLTEQNTNMLEDKSDE